ncbi:Predicted component of the ribosome quality control (RQC) complex, YloA/Tae2 family, contains fibronectin-binding (FbpA) and DUF814 domains [Caminicella sporogenes DSM 14501]|uniref:Rqc2 homolog RqcH n=1 Tax=Caminicella sporogenes DSM 14501 TaxID=1121266 RepID=A0A1M6LIX1_9FIRM|nr:NFACT RNA binding domain-containing protein [Caminicella sporogenes]RKD27844.1 hypothetical protein BET04_01910 [Caminicella sporogenes]SHJ71110.1 Predicted component of the ribosome quality control (RQC) complex, YloA/Tae2 family, contains fibronectin-binding (FbpA) and DUF814 domains [Caminicella sporogenes DSM 14501]
MPFDGFVINSLIKELKNTLINTRINKIYQSDSDELIIKLKNSTKNNILLISVNSNYPHICLTNEQKENPLTPPMFCMLLRKHIQNGKIVDINQVEFERIIIFTIESYDELGNRCFKELIVEIMGKHSNIILVDGNSKKIIDSIKRIPLNISRQRQVLPGLKYINPPSQGKINIFDCNFENFLNKISEFKKTEPVYKVLYKSFQGVSPIVAKEICLRLNINFDEHIENINQNHLKQIWLQFTAIKKDLDSYNIFPNIVSEINNKKYIDFSSLDLKIYNEKIFKKLFFNSINDTIKHYYYEKAKYEKIRQKSSNLKKLISTKLDSLYNKLQKQKEELLIAKDADKYKLYGELILANLYKISKGMNEIEVENYYDENLSKITIPLDVRLEPNENSQYYFKKYNKFKNALKKISTQIEETKKEIEYLENVLTSIENADDVQIIEDIKDELIQQNIFKRKNKSSKKAKQNISLPNKYLSSDGFIIEAGKNNRQNDYLTLKASSKNDIWFHTKEIPGSHVVIKTNGLDVPKSTIIEAAKIAAYHSKARYSSNVPVDYTLIKFVKKPSGAKPGMVIYDNYKTIYVTPDEEDIKKLQTQRK